MLIGAVAIALMAQFYGHAGVQAAVPHKV
jgi:hypothetical protein